MRDAIIDPATGNIIYQIDNTQGYYVYNGSSWVLFNSNYATGITKSVDDGRGGQETVTFLPINLTSATGSVQITRQGLLTVEADAVVPNQVENPEDDFLNFINAFKWDFPDFGTTDIKFDLSKVDGTANTIDLGNSDYGLSAGDSVTYDNGGGTSIGGLSEGETYYVYSVDKTDPSNVKIKLAQESTDSLAVPLSVSDGNGGTTTINVLTVDLDPSVATGNNHKLEAPAGIIKSIANEGEAAISPLETGFGYFTGYLSSNLGVADKIATSYVGASAMAGDGDKPNNSGNEFAFSGSVNLLEVTNSATAYIGAGAQINQNSTFNSAEQTVNVIANASVETVNVGGLTSVANFWGGATQGEGGAVGGTLELISYTNSATAYIDDGASVHAGRDVNVESSVNNWVIDATISGVKAKKFGVSGAVGLNFITSSSIAYIEDTATVAAGYNANVTAHNNILDVNVAGSIPAIKILKDSTQEVAVGLSAGVNDINDTTKAFIGNQNTSSTFTTPGSVTTTNGDVTVQAKESENLFNVVIATAIAPGKSYFDVPAGTPDDDPLDGISLPNLFQETDTVKSRTKQSAGIGLSGLVTMNMVTDDTEAYISGVTVHTNKLDVAADDSTLAISASGSIAFGGGEGGMGLAGAFAMNDFNRTTGAYTGNATITASEVDITASDEDTLMTFTTGFAGTKPKAGKAAIAGSVNLNMIDDNTFAALGDGTNLSASGNITINAHRTLNSISVAGAIAISGKAGIGAGADVGIIDSKVRSYIGAGTTVTTTGGNISILSSLAENVISVGASIGIGSQKLGMSGAASSWSLDSDMSSYIADGATVTANDSILIDSDEATKFLLIGGFIGAGSSAGLGASVGNDNIDRKVKAYIGDATVTAKGNGSAITDPSGTMSGYGLLIDATAEYDLIVVGAGGAGGEKFGFAASAVVSVISDDVEAYIGAGAYVNTDTSGTISSSQQVWLHADDSMDLLSVGGSVAGSEKAGIGAAANVITVNKTVKAYVDSSSANKSVVLARGDIKLDASEEFSLVAVSAGIGVGIDSLGISATAVVLTLTTDTEAYAADYARLMAGSNVRIEAASDDWFCTVAGQVAFGGKAGIGGSASVIVKNETVKAYVGQYADVTARAGGLGLAVYTGAKDSSGNKLTATQDGVSVNAVSYEKFITIAAGGAGGGKAGIAGSADSNTLTETTYAYIDSGADINKYWFDGSLNLIADTGANAAQGIYVLASNETDIFSLAGAIGIGGNVGIGAGADVGIITKHTCAWVSAAEADAQNDVIIQALSTEDIMSLAVNVGIGGSAGIAGAASSYT